MELTIEEKFSGEIKDVDTKGRVVTGYLSSFDNKDSDGDIIVKGAFEKSIVERKSDIFFLNQHNWQQPLSKFNVLIEDSKGLYFESEPLPNTSYANDVLELYDTGVLKEHSIGFYTVKGDYDRDTDIRYIKEVKLLEGSVVTMGANRNTPFTGFKATDKFSLEEMYRKHKKELYKAISEGFFTPERKSLLEIAIRQLERQAQELFKKSLLEPPKSTPEPMEEETKAILEFLNI